jgi:TRAP-type mannitol/chloroaromatic compound transport system permease large subunit
MAAILIISFAIGLIVGLPVAITMGISGLTAVLIDGRFPPLIVPQYLFNGISSFPLMAVPFFILAAEIMTASGLTASLLRFANDLVGHIRGGLGHVNVLVSMLFAGISGSALADGIGRTQGYQICSFPARQAGSTQTSSCLGIQKLC